MFICQQNVRKISFYQNNINSVVVVDQTGTDCDKKLPQRLLLEAQNRVTSHKSKVKTKLNICDFKLQNESNSNLPLSKNQKSNECYQKVKHKQKKSENDNHIQTKKILEHIQADTLSVKQWNNNSYPHKQRLCVDSPEIFSRGRSLHTFTHNYKINQGSQQPNQLSSTKSAKNVFDQRLPIINSSKLKIMQLKMNQIEEMHKKTQNNCDKILPIFSGQIKIDNKYRKIGDEHTKIRIDRQSDRKIQKKKLKGLINGKRYKTNSNSHKIYNEKDKKSEQKLSVSKIEHEGCVTQADYTSCPIAGTKYFFINNLSLHQPPPMIKQPSSQSLGCLNKHHQTSNTEQVNNCKQKLIVNKFKQAQRKNRKFHSQKTNSNKNDNNTFSRKFSQQIPHQLKTTKAHVHQDYHQLHNKQHIMKKLWLHMEAKRKVSPVKAQQNLLSGWNTQEDEHRGLF